MKTGLYIFVEGSDDTRFVNNIIKPVIEDEFNYIKVVEYAQATNEYIINFIESIHGMRADYILLGDLDYHDCFLNKVDIISDRFEIIEKDKIYIVIKEIESWYLAGIDSETSRLLNINHFDDTEEIDKERFLSLKPDQYDSVIDYKQELLKHYSIEIAQSQNDSFKYFKERFIDGSIEI